MEVINWMRHLRGTQKQFPYKIRFVATPRGSLAPWGYIGRYPVFRRRRLSSPTHIYSSVRSSGAMCLGHFTADTLTQCFRIQTKGNNQSCFHILQVVETYIILEKIPLCQI